jgi:hypothetical protein
LIDILETASFGVRDVLGGEQLRIFRCASCDKLGRMKQQLGFHQVENGSHGLACRATTIDFGHLSQAFCQTYFGSTCGFSIQAVAAVFHCFLTILSWH